MNLSALSREALVDQFFCTAACPLPDTYPLARDGTPESLQPREGHCRCGSGHATPSTFTTGYAYARMGYTMAFEPAMLPANARQAHEEMADVPLLDKGAYALLGNDDLFLKLLQDGAGPDAIKDYVAWTFRASQALAIKIVNPGGISAFKFNGRRMDLDDQGPFYGTTPRTILTTLADACISAAAGFLLHDAYRQGKLTRIDPEYAGTDQGWIILGMGSMIVQAEAVDEPASGRGRGRQAHLGAGPTGGVTNASRRSGRQVNS